MSFNPRYDFNYECAATASKATIFKTLVYEGPLKLAKEHMVATLMPDALDDGASAGEKKASQTLLHVLALPAMVMVNEVSTGGMHFKLTKGRLAKLFRAMDTAGTINMTPIPGGPEQAIPIASKRFAVAIAALPSDERTIEAADVWYDGASDDAGTDTFYDWCTPALLARGSGGMEVVAQFCNVTPGCFFNDSTDGGRDSDFFKDIIEQMTGSRSRARAPRNASTPPVLRGQRSVTKHQALVLASHGRPHLLHSMGEAWRTFVHARSWA